MKNVTISLGGVGVKVNLDNVTNFTGFFFEGVPYLIEADPLPLLGEHRLCHLGLVANLTVNHPQQARSQT